MNRRVTAIVVAIALLLLGVTWVVAMRSHVDPDSLAIRATNERIDINEADADELMLLPGVGPTTAQRIVDYRNEHGRFESVDGLDRVERIGAVTVERLRPYVTVGGEPIEAQ